MNDSDEKKSSQPELSVGAGVAIGTGIGAAIFAATDNPAFIAVGAGVGAAIGAGYGVARKRKQKD